MNICNLDIDHFNLLNLIEKTPLRSLKNLPTTWGLRRETNSSFLTCEFSEKPPHHMGIKTLLAIPRSNASGPLKNLPTTWGLRLVTQLDVNTQPFALKNLPTTWGLRLELYRPYYFLPLPLKNLPTTWGLRL